MFWTNMVKPPTIERAAMDGTSRVTLHSGLGTPGELAVHEPSETLFWTDMEVKSIYCSDFDGGNRRVLVSGKILQPVGLAVFDSYLYWIDKNQNLIEHVNAMTGEDRKLIQTRVTQLSDIIAVEKMDPAVVVRHPCSGNNGGCSHICYTKGDNKEICSCPVDLQLTDDDKTCAEPPTCGPDHFTCLSGNIDCIPKVWQCDGYSECADGSDEKNCPTCSPNQFRCDSGQCIQNNERCDTISQCQDNSDEENCPPCPADKFECQADKTCIDRMLECNMNDDCSDGADEFHCPITPSGSTESPTAQLTVGPADDAHRQLSRW